MGKRSAVAQQKADDLAYRAAIDARRQLVAVKAQEPTKPGAQAYLRHVALVPDFLKTEVTTSTVQSESFAARACHKCGGPLAVRVNARTGTTFGGCRAYPQCKGTISFPKIHRRKSTSKVAPGLVNAVVDD